MWFMSVGELSRAIVTPMHKNDDTSDVSNCGPLLHLCVTSKITVTDVFVYFAKALIILLIDRKLYEFLFGHSRSTNLLESQND